MAIKKRDPSTILTTPEPEPQRLVIVAKEKRPIPEAGVIRAVLGDQASRETITRLSLIAQSVGEFPDERFTPEDRVVALRTPYDQDNPQEARYRNRIRNRATAITAMCVVCMGGRKGVTECAETSCPLWAFRFGSDPFRGKRK
jgi:hypothetical protein